MNFLDLKSNKFKLNDTRDFSYEQNSDCVCFVLLNLEPPASDVYTTINIRVHSSCSLEKLNKY